MIIPVILTAITAGAPPQGYIPITSRPTPNVSVIVLGPTGAPNGPQPPQPGDQVSFFLTGRVTINPALNNVSWGNIRLMVILERTSGNGPQRISFNLSPAPVGQAEANAGQFVWIGNGPYHDGVTTTLVAYKTKETIGNLGDKYNVSFRSYSAISSTKTVTEPDGNIEIK